MPIHSIWRCSNTYINIQNGGTGCSQCWFSASIMTHQHYISWAWTFLIFSHHLHVQHKGALICPFTAYEGAQTLHVHQKKMREAVTISLQPHPWVPMSFGLHHTADPLVFWDGQTLSKNQPASHSCQHHTKYVVESSIVALIIFNVFCHHNTALFVH